MENADILPKGTSRPDVSSGRDTESYGGGNDYNSNDTSDDRTSSSKYGSAATSGTGFGNKHTSGMGGQTGELPADYGSDNRESSQQGNSDPYSGHREYGSGATGGAGFGNKTRTSDEPSEGGYGGNPELARNSDPYSGNSGYGSGATGGAGFGNKKNSYGGDSTEDGGSGGE